MQQVFSRISYVVGDSEILLKMSGTPTFPVFAERILNFLGNLSSVLLKNKEAKQYADVVTLAFWCRKAHLLSLKHAYERSCLRIGKGVAFHIAPSNVPVNFAYTLFAGMLSGNLNIVRLPSKPFAQVNLICGEINRLLESGRFNEIRGMICLINYLHESEITDYLSAMCNVRIIWGGDSTVFHIKQSPLPPRANDLTFPDRYSLCLINAEKYIDSNHYSKIARDFFNDTYLTDQNACTAPKIVFWFGTNTQKAKDIFWNTLSELLETNYSLQPVQTINKLTTFYKYAARHKCHLSLTGNYKITRVEVDRADEVLMEYQDNSGYFYEVTASSLSDILPLCGAKCQTLSYFGFKSETLKQFIFCNAPRGVDRITPIGKTLEFSLVWDGIDLIQAMSRVIDSL